MKENLITKLHDFLLPSAPGERTGTSFLHMAEVQMHTEGVLVRCSEIDKEIEKRKEERILISLICTSLEEKAPVSRSTRRCSALSARMLVFQRGNDDEMELVAQLCGCPSMSWIP
jgi:hypothetical protein